MKENKFIHFSCFSLDGKKHLFLENSKDLTSRVKHRWQGSDTKNILKKVALFWRKEKSKEEKNVQKRKNHIMTTKNFQLYKNFQAFLVTSKRKNFICIHNQNINENLVLNLKEEIYFD